MRYYAGIKKGPKILLLLCIYNAIPHNKPLHRETTKPSTNLLLNTLYIILPFAINRVYQLNTATTNQRLSFPPQKKRGMNSAGRAIGTLLTVPFLTSPASVATLVLRALQRSANSSEQDSWSPSSSHNNREVVTVTDARPPPDRGCNTSDSVCLQITSQAADLSAK